MSDRGEKYGGLDFSKITARGQATLPKRVREAAGLYAGDLIAFEVEGDRVTLRKVPTRGDDAYLRGLSQTLGEWESEEDEEAWREL